MEWIQTVLSATKDGGVWGLLSFSLLINGALAYVIKVMWKNDQDRRDQVHQALHEVKLALGASNELLRVLVGRRR